MAQWQFQGVCYPSPLAANTAAASAMSGTVSGGVAVSVTSVTDTAISFDSLDLASGVITAHVLAVEPYPCQLLDAADALSLSWSVVGVWLASYAVMFLARSVWASVVQGGSRDA